LDFIEGKKEPRNRPKQELNGDSQADVFMTASDKSSHACISLSATEFYHQFCSDGPFDSAAVASSLHDKLQCCRRRVWKQVVVWDAFLMRGRTRCGRPN
jgi:hypothetical protein